MSDSTPVKNVLIPAVAQMMSARLVNDGCDFVLSGVSSHVFCHMVVMYLWMLGF